MLQEIELHSKSLDHSVDWYNTDVVDEKHLLSIPQEIFSGDDIAANIYPCDIQKGHESPIIRDQCDSLTFANDTCFVPNDVVYETDESEVQFFKITKQSIQTNLSSINEHLAFRANFSRYIEELFITYMHSKPKPNMSFDDKKYLQYCSYLNDGRSIIKSLSGDPRAKYGYKLRRVEKEYMMIQGQLYRRKQKGPVPVIVIDKLIPIVAFYHLKMNHAGYKRTWKAVKEKVHGISGGDIAWLLLRCLRCVRFRDKSTIIPLSEIPSTDCVNHA